MKRHLIPALLAMAGAAFVRTVRYAGQALKIQLQQSPMRSTLTAAILLTLGICVTAGAFTHSGISNIYK